MKYVKWPDQTRIGLEELPQKALRAVPNAHHVEAVAYGPNVPAGKRHEVDREEYRQLWRDTQRELHALTLKIADTNDTVVRLAEESRDADKRLAERIDALVSAIGQFLSR